MKRAVELWKDGEYVGWYPSASEAGRSIGVTEQHARECLKKGSRVKGYDIVVSEKQSDDIIESGGSPGGGKNKPVEVSKDGKRIAVFISLTDCARWLGVDPAMVRRALREGRRARGYDFKVVEEIDYILWKIEESNKHYEFSRK